MKKSPIHKFIRFSGIGIQLGLTVYLASVLGAYLDKKVGVEKPWFSLLFIVLAIALFIYSLVKQLNKLNDE